MTPDDICEMGDYCEALFLQPMFSALVSHFEQQCAQNFLNTEPHQKDERDQVFAAFDGFRSFLGFAHNFIQARDNIRAEQNPEPLSDHDADYQD